MLKDKVHLNDVSDCKVVELRSTAQFDDLCSFDLSEACDFNPVSRIYYLYDVDTSAIRGSHAHYDLKQLIVAASGSFVIELFDGLTKRQITLDSKKKGLLIVPGIWRELSSFSNKAVCLVLASHDYLEKDYIRDLEEFKQYRNVDK